MGSGGLRGNVSLAALLAWGRFACWECASLDDAWSGPGWYGLVSPFRLPGRLRVDALPGRIPMQEHARHLVVGRPLERSADSLAAQSGPVVVEGRKTDRADQDADHYQDDHCVPICH
jgi:hypothetical protein